MAFFSAPGFGGWKNLRHIHANARGINGNTSATATKITMNRYGSGVIQFGIKFARKGQLPTLILKRATEQLIQLSRAPTRLICSSVLAVSSNEEVFATKVPAELDGISVFLLPKDALVRNKLTVGRPQDLADLDTLES